FLCGLSGNLSFRRAPRRTLLPRLFAELALEFVSIVEMGPTARGLLIWSFPYPARAIPKLALCSAGFHRGLVLRICLSPRRKPDGIGFIARDGRYGLANLADALI